MKNQHTVIEAFSEMAPEYERKVNNELQRFWGLSYYGFIDNLIDMTPLDDEDWILDVATGTSVIPMRLIERGKTKGKIFGVDITQAMLMGGKKKLELRGAKDLVRLTCGSALCMPFQSNRFDTILCGLASHHMDVDILLAEISRVLKPGGRLTIADVGGSPIWQYPVISTLIRTATYFYFLCTEGAARASSKSSTRMPSTWALPCISQRGTWNNATSG